MQQRLFYFYYRPLIIFMLLLVLSGCDQVRQSFGLNRSQPDEFMVMDRPPLSVPPSMVLKSPVSPRANYRHRQVQNLILKPPSTIHTKTSQAENDLLSKVQAHKNPAGIRTMIEDDAKKEPSSEKGLAEDLVFWKKSRPTGDIIDPVAEKERLHSSLPEASQDAP